MSHMTHMSNWHQVEIEYSYQATSGLKEAKVTAAVADDDDLDIDNI